MRPLRQPVFQIIATLLYLLVALCTSHSKDHLCMFYSKDCRGAAVSQRSAVSGMEQSQICACLCSASPFLTPDISIHHLERGPAKCHGLGQWGEVGRRLPRLSSPTQAKTQRPFPELESAFLIVQTFFILSCHLQLHYTFLFTFIAFLSCSSKSSFSGTEKTAKKFNFTVLKKSPQII